MPMRIERFHGLGRDGRFAESCGSRMSGSRQRLRPPVPRSPRITPRSVITIRIIFARGLSVMRVLIAVLLASAGLLTSTTQVARAAGPPVQLAGTWQGTLDVGSRRLRIVVQLHKGSAGAWDAAVYSIDVSSAPIPVPWVRLNGSSLRLSVNSRAEYAGTISADGNRIQGEWTQGRAFPLNLERATAKTAWPLDTSPHKIQFVSVEQGVKLEVLDWGGPGRPVILLAGLGNDAHVFDQFAPKLAAWYHVYGITRRGFGASSAPAMGYSADRLGEDVVAVMKVLRIDRPVLIGHSLAGEELSYVGSRYPEKVAGLVYLDAGYVYAFYDTTGKGRDDNDAVRVTINDLQRKLTQLNQMLLADNRQLSSALIDELMATDLPRVRRDLRTVKRALQSERGPTSAVAPLLSPTEKATLLGFEEFTSVRVPILAIFADPHTNPRPPNAPRRTSAQVAADDARDKENVEAAISVVERDSPGAHIVRLPHANHYVFLSNEDEVLKDVHGFIQALPLP